MTLDRRWLTRGSALVAALALGGCVVERPADPVVITGASAPSLQGDAPGKVVAFKYLNERWTQVPVQVDERAVVDLAKPLNKPAIGKTFLTYTDPNTFTGADPNANLDADDEIVFMGIDSGAKAPAGSNPAGIVAGSGVEVRVRDAVGDPTDSYAYLFKQSGGLDPAAGKRYVNYSFNLLSGDYKSTYKTTGGGNPENTTASTAFYSHHFSERWINDALRITAPNASGVDILDRHKNLFAPGNCGRTENTFSSGAGAFIANKNGPVRGIRSVIGANSGTYTSRENVFYERRQDIRTYLRVHEIPSVMDLFDYSPAASGMTYKNDLNTGGVTIDGVPDPVATGQMGWESVDGPQGSLGIVRTVDTDIPGFASDSYYLDKQAPGTGAETQCTGDSSAYGMSGTWIKQRIPNTDPTATPTNRLTVTGTLLYDSPGKADGPRLKAHAGSPLQASVAPR